MQRLWTVVLLSGEMHRAPVVGRDAAVSLASKLLDQSVSVSHICPIAIEHDTDIIPASEIPGLAAELTTAARSGSVSQPTRAIEYRLYFRGPTGIIGRDDFGAGGDAEALAIAETLFDACSDLCTSFDLCQGGRRVPVRSNPSSMSADHIRERAQAIVIEREEVIQLSRWAIAKSKRLLARIDEAYRSRAFPS